MSRRLAFLLVVALGLWGRPDLSISAAAPPVYVVDDLGSLGGNFTMPLAINEAGDVAGSAQTASFDYHAFLYTDAGGIRDLGTFNGTGWSQVFGINNARHMTGYFTRANGSVGAFLHGDDIGTIELEPLPGASMTSARALNDADQVTGASSGSAGAHAFIWSAALGMRDIGTLQGPVSNGQRINASGQVAGQAIAINDPYFPIYHAFRYTDGTGMQDLGTLPGTSRTASSGTGINAAGDVVGYSNDPGYGVSRAFLYTDADGMRDLGTFGGRNSFARFINDNGAVVGIADLVSGQQHPFIYTAPAGIVDLNTLIDSSSGWTLWTAEAINNQGTIVGVATMGGRSRGYRARRVRDDSAPEIDVAISPPPTATGWNSSDVTVVWTVRDPETGIASSSGCETQTVAQDTAGLTLTCSAVNPLGGSSTRSIVVRIDGSAPEIDVSISPPPNAAGWSSGDVSVRWITRDAGSGVASSSGCDTQTLTQETAGLTLTCSATNLPGASTTRSIVVKIDKTAPVMACVATPARLWPPNGRMVPVSIAVSVADPMSAAGGFTLESISVDNRNATPDAVVGFVPGTASTTGQVRAARTGDVTRVYRFTYTSSNLAGLTASCTASILVARGDSDPPD